MMINSQCHEVWNLPVRYQESLFLVRLDRFWTLKKFNHLDMVPVQEQGVVGVLTEDGNDNVVPDLKCLPCLENSTFRIFR